MSEEVENSRNRTSPLSRRKVLQMVGGGTVAATGVSGIFGKATAESHKEIQRRKLSGNKKTKYIQIVKKSEAFRTLRTEVRNTHNGTIDSSEVTVYELVKGSEKRQVVSFSINGVENAVESSIALRINNGSVIYSKGLIAKPTTNNGATETVTKENLDKNDSLVVDEFNFDKSTNSIKSDTSVVSGDQSTSQNGGVSTNDACQGPCTFALNAACPGLCALSGAAFCAIVTSYSGPAASFGCGAFFVFYCLIVDYGNPCFYKSSPEADCREIVCPHF